MSDHDGLDIPDDDVEPEDEDGEVSEIEYLDDQDAINNSDDFRARFGFDHECHCADDWAVGNLGVVAVCYLNMCRDAMEHLATAREELAQRDDEIASLRIELADK